MVAVEDILLHEIRAWWRKLNTARFGGKLRPPVLVLERRAELGRWVASTRTLSLSWSLVIDHRWGEVVSVLEHEMAHQYVTEVLGVHDETAHGASFRAVCAERGIDARAAGAPADGGQAESSIVRRIRKLLALADSPVESEARAAMNAAYRLMLKHNIDLASAAAPQRYVVRQVGETKARHSSWEHVLTGILAGHFFVEVTIVPAFDVATAKPSTAFEIAGTPENVEIATWVWDFLAHTGERLWRAHRTRHGLKGDAARRSFLEGLMTGFREKLEGETTRTEQEEGLVWVGDPGLDGFLHRRWPSRSGGRRYFMGRGDAHDAGRAAGREIVLRKPIRDQGTGPVRALTGPSRG